MIDVIEDYIETFGEQTKQRFGILYHLILESTDEPIEEKLWARIPSFYCDNSFIRFIPFKDHINIEAKAIMAHKEKCQGYKITPKGMLKLDHKQEILAELLKMIFKESLEPK